MYPGKVQTLSLIFICILWCWTNFYHVYGHFFKKAGVKSQTCPPFDFDQLWLKSGPLAPEHVAKLIYALTLYLRGKNKIKPKKVLISIPQRPPWTKRYQRS